MLAAALLQPELLTHPGSMGCSARTHAVRRSPGFSGWWDASGAVGFLTAALMGTIGGLVR